MATQRTPRNDVAATLALLRRIPGLEVSEIDSGCCGMAGAFGMTADHHALSMKIGELVLFPSVRETVVGKGAVLATGTSCRHQIKDGTGARAVHPVQWLADRLG